MSAARPPVAGCSSVSSTPWSMRVENLLDGPLAEGPLAENGGLLMVLEAGGDDLAGRGGCLVDEHGDRKPADRSVAAGPMLVEDAAVAIAGRHDQPRRDRLRRRSASAARPDRGTCRRPRSPPAAVRRDCPQIDDQTLHPLVDHEETTAARMPRSDRRRS